MLRNSVLTGSLTTTSVKINAIEVEEFDAGFNSRLGYENDFQEISFD